MKYYAKFKSPDGEYVDSTGVRYDVSAVRRVRNADGVNVGYVPFPSRAAALAAMKLEPVPEPEEEMLGGEVIDAETLNQQSTT